MLGDPEVVLIGIPGDGRDGKPLDESWLDAASGTIDSIPRKRRDDPELVQRSGAPRRAFGRQPGLGQEAALSTCADGAARFQTE